MNRNQMKSIAFTTVKIILRRLKKRLELNIYKLKRQREPTNKEKQCNSFPS